MAPGITPEKQLMRMLKEHLRLQIDFNDDDNMLEVTILFDDEIVDNEYTYLDHNHEISGRLT